MFTRKVNLIGICLFATVWVLILVIPKTRLLLHTQFLQAYNYPQPNSFPSIQQIPTLQELAKQHPDDAKGQALLVASEYSSKNNTQSYKDRLVNFDKLIQRFPDDKWLLLDRMRASLAGGFSSPKGSYSLDDKGKPAYFFHGTGWLTSAQRKQTIRIAQLGERKDPNNSFYNWVEGICRYDLGQKEKALDAFQRGSLKTDYDDGTLQDTRNRLSVQQLMMPTLLEDRWLATVAQLFPQYAIMRHANQIAIWQGAMQEKSGNNKKALDIYGAQMRLSQIMLKDTDNNIGWFTARGILWNTWRSFKRKKLTDNTGYASEGGAGRKVLFMQQAQRFASYAQKYGRADLATQAISAANLITSNPLYGQNIFERSFLFQPIKSLKSLALLKWSGAMFLKLMLAALVLWGCIAGLILFAEKVILAKTDIPRISPKAIGSILCVVFVLICMIAGTAILLSKAWSHFDLFEMMLFSQDFQSVPEMGALLGSLQRWIPWITFGIMFFYCLLPACWKMRKSTFTADDSKSTKFADSFLVLMGKVLIGVPLLVLQVVWAPWVLSQFISGKNATLILFFLYLTIPLPLICFLVFLWWTGRTQTISPRFFAGTYWVYALKLMRNSLALLIVVCSVVYAVTSFVSLPIRNNANATLSRFVDVGQMQYLRETMEDNKTRNTKAE